MKIVKPVLDYLGIELGASPTDAPAAPPPPPRSRWYHSVITCLLVLGCLGSSYFIGWQRRGESVPQFAERPTTNADSVLARIGGLGVECDEPLEYSERSSGSWVFCKGSPRFDLHVSPSIEEAYEAFDLASLLGCYTVGNLPFKQFYLARDSNWNLL
ncbi:MAG: hypothetical protein ACKOAZ_07090, partial [Ilumatobacteraceae bacterium]